MAAKILPELPRITITPARFPLECATVGCPYLACVVLVAGWADDTAAGWNGFYPTCAPCWLRWALAERN